MQRPASLYRETTRRATAGFRWNDAVTLVATRCDMVRPYRGRAAEEEQLCLAFPAAVSCSVAIGASGAHKTHSVPSIGDLHDETRASATRASSSVVSCHTTSCIGCRNSNPCRKTLRLRTIARVVATVIGTLIFSSTVSPIFSSTGRIAVMPDSLMSRLCPGKNPLPEWTVTSVSNSNRW